MIWSLLQFQETAPNQTCCPQGLSDEGMSIQVRTVWQAGMKWKQPATIRRGRRKGLWGVNEQETIGIQSKGKCRKHSRKSNSYRAVCKERGGKVTLWPENHKFWRKISYRITETLWRKGSFIHLISQFMTISSLPWANPLLGTAGLRLNKTQFLPSGCTVLKGYGEKGHMLPWWAVYRLISSTILESAKSEGS